jgi:hypothetical protein
LRPVSFVRKSSTYIFFFKQLYSIKYVAWESNERFCFRYRLLMITRNVRECGLASWTRVLAMR